MRCHVCRSVSFLPLCKTCRRELLQPEPKTRRLDNGLEVISFYAYDDIEPFLLTKHLPHGWAIYRILAKESFSSFKRNIESGTTAIPIDDDPKSGYSHTAILARSLKSAACKTLYGKLHAQNRISYAGRSKSFRLQNPRNFLYTGSAGIKALLVDDIVTTGFTLMEAGDILARHDVEVSGAIVLADADRKG
ncbi:ComF family protein [Hydrogenimonas sp.]